MTKEASPLARLLQEVDSLRKQIKQLEQLEAEHAAAVEAVRHSEAKFRDLYDSAPVGYHEIDTEGRITRVNQSELVMLGYAAQDAADSDARNLQPSHRNHRQPLSSRN